MFQMPQFRKDQYLALIVVVSMILVSPTRSIASKPEVVRRQIALIQPADVPVLDQSQEQAKQELLDSLFAESVYVSDEASGSILLSKNPDQELYPASTTKIMTALVARENYYLTQVLTVGQGALSEGNVIGLVQGEKISVNQLLKGLLIRSGNDAAAVLAHNHPQGMEGFVQAMNQKAEQLRLKQSRYSNPSGLDAIDQVMSAHDLAIITREVFKDQALLEIMGQTTAESVDASGLLKHQLGHTHQLLYSDDSVIAGKTGTTEGAGQVLVTLFEREDQSGQKRQVLVVVMGSKDRYADTNTIIDWVFATYQWQQVSL